MHMCTIRSRWPSDKLNHVCDNFNLLYMYISQYLKHWFCLLAMLTIAAVMVVCVHMIVNSCLLCRLPSKALTSIATWYDTFYFWLGLPFNTKGVLYNYMQSCVNCRYVYVRTYIADTFNTCKVYIVLNYIRTKVTSYQYQ